MKYRKKPVVIEAIQYSGSNYEDIWHWVGEEKNLISQTTKMGSKWLTVRTLEGDMRADIGDWIIKGIKGEFYPCKPDIFEATYEAVEEDATNG